MGRHPLHYLEIGLIVLLLVVLGIVTFSRLSTEEKAVIELEASLEQLYHMEADYFARHKRYFDPQADDYRDYLPWLEDCACQVRFGDHGVVGDCQGGYRRGWRGRRVADRREWRAGGEAGGGLRDSIGAVVAPTGRSASVNSRFDSTAMRISPDLTELLSYLPHLVQRFGHFGIGRRAGKLQVYDIWPGSAQF